jgi:5'-nucleotidase
VKRPLILVTNDDGILADGIGELSRALEPLGEIVVCAPSRQQSAVSHGISLNEPLRVRTIGDGRFAIAGTPADAVFVGLSEICPRVPDIVVSGINHGSNLGTDVFYSGTLAGALEGALRGVQSVAFSQQMPPAGQVSNDESERAQKANAWDPLEHLSSWLDRLLCESARFAASLVESLLRDPLPPGTALNVNSPSRPSDGFCWTRVGSRAYRSQVVRRVDPRGNPYYWIGDSPEDAPHEPGTDSHAVDAGFHSVTPIRLDWSAELPRPSTMRPNGFATVELRA